MEAVPGTIRFEDSRRIPFGNPVSPLGNRAFDVGSIDGEQVFVGVLAPNAATSSDDDAQAESDEPVMVQIDYIHNFFELLEQRVQ
jgi:hypothetical protein